MEFCRYQAINKETLRNLSLQKNWIANPQSFNDPMEFRLMNEYDAIKVRIEEINSTQRLKNRNRLSKMISEFGVVCYSFTHGYNNLMWSHYGDSHKGMCLVFDVTNVNDEAVGIYKVNYVDHFKLPEVDLNYTEITLREELLKIVTTKSIDWSYEKEYRQIFYSKNEYTEYPGPLIRIIFGCQTSKNDIELVINLVRNKYEKITISKSYIDRNSYNLGTSSFDLFIDKKYRIPDFWDGKCIK